MNRSFACAKLGCRCSPTTTALGVYFSGGIKSEPISAGSLWPAIQKTSRKVLQEQLLHQTNNGRYGHSINPIPVSVHCIVSKLKIGLHDAHLRTLQNVCVL